MAQPPVEYVQIRRVELVQIVKELSTALDMLDAISKERPIVFMMKSRLEALLQPEPEDEKTPTRSPSTATFRLSLKDPK
jgi:hypothetical protein